MSKFVRSSSFRHVFGKAEKAENLYDGIKLTRSAWDSNLICASRTFWALSWGSAGGGSVAVWPLEKTGKLPQKESEFPLIAGHKSNVLDCVFSPFNDNLLATASEDCYVKLWAIPEGGLKQTMVDHVQVLKGHKRKVGTVNFHPTANNVLATSSQDYTVKVWDVEKGNELYSLTGPTDLIQAVSWNRNGSKLALTCKDKKNRVSDPRQGATFAQEWLGHEGVKGSRCVWLNGDYLLTVGFDKVAQREFSVWDTRNVEKPIKKVGVDNASGLLMAYYDYDTSMVYFAGKGDGNIRYWEFVPADEGVIFPLSEFKSSEAQKGGCFIPKTSCRINECEVARFLKVETFRITPISFTVPRKSDLFQEDIFPNTADGAGEPALTQEEWKSGVDKEPVTVHLGEGFVVKPKAQPLPAFDTKPMEKELTETEVRKAYDEAQNRITYLEAEVARLQLKVKELGG